MFRPRRLEAEELRDAMLRISGELNPVLGGIPIRPDMNLEAALQPRMIMGTFAPSYVPNPLPKDRNRRSHLHPPNPRPWLAVHGDLQPARQRKVMRAARSIQHHTSSLHAVQWRGDQRPRPCAWRLACSVRQVMTRMLPSIACFNLSSVARLTPRNERM